MALWLTATTFGTRRDVHISNFHTDQKFTVRIRRSNSILSMPSRSLFVQEYTIEIFLDDIHWQVKKRYSEFAEFHEQLTKQISNIDVKSLPPKKLLNNNAQDFLHRRRLALDNYLKYLFQFFTTHSLPLPECFIKFLDFHLYVNTRTASAIYSRLCSFCSLGSARHRSDTRREFVPKW